MTRNAYAPPHPENLTILNMGWNGIIAGVWGTEVSALPQAWTTLQGMERPSPIDSDPAYWAGQLVLAHEPLFTAWAADGVTRTEMDAARAKIVDVLAPKDNDPPLTHMQPGMLDIKLQAVASSLTLRERTKDGVIDPALFVSYPAPAYASLPGFTDGDVGPHNQYVHTPHDAESVPTRILDTGDGAKRKTGFRELDNVAVIGIAGLLLAKLREVGPIKNRGSDSSARFGALAHVIDLLVAEASLHPPNHSQRQVLNRTSLALVTQITAYHRAHSSQNSQPTRGERQG